MKTISLQKITKAGVSLIAWIFILPVLFASVSAQINSYNKAEGHSFDLVSFTTGLNKSEIDLNWSTIHEKNLSHFVVQRSIDGADYKDIGVVFSINKKEGEQSYMFRDQTKTIKGNTAYYRLIFIQDDGGFFSSGIKAVQLTQDKKS